jgi:hypothetical protein
MARKVTVVASDRLADALDHLNKSALIDLVVDRARAEIGEDTTDEDVANYLQPAVDTLCLLRGDPRVELRVRIARFDRAQELRLEAERFQRNESEARDGEGVAG